ncbi:MAG: hypothetical protein H7343_02450 [Undibacterium sp.]|nr:hypothetical protein [Opitutaceae bacterium]
MIWPIVPVEGDETGVANGVESWSRGGTDFKAAAYLYEIQPGSYRMLHALQWMTGAQPLQIFGVVTALGATTFLVLSSLLVAHVLALRAAWVAVVLLTAQELTAAAAYANTSAVAGSFAMGALVLTQRSRSFRGVWCAGVLIGLGGYFRLDSLLLSPALLALRLGIAHDPLTRALRTTAVTALIAAATLLTAFTLSEVSLQTAWSAFSNRGSVVTWNPLWVKGWLVLGFVATVTAWLGLGWLVVRRNWSLLALILAGSLPSLAVYGGSFTTPKYLYYAVPFLALPIFDLVREAWTQTGAWRTIGRSAALLAVALHLLEGTFGVQTSSEEFRRFIPAPSPANLLSVQSGPKKIRVGIGEGEVIPTDDGPRLRGGQLWAPAMWRREKRAMAETLASLDSVLRTSLPDLIVTSNYLSFRVLDGWLRDHGFTATSTTRFPGDPVSHRTIWRRDHLALTTVLLNQSPLENTEFASVSQLGHRALLISDRGPLGTAHLLGNQVNRWTLLSEHRHALFALYLRHPS